ncbi:dihydrofolate reductase [Alteromonas sp. KUL156]|nr:dihydrofolate reductase [Alteromonas sp. KUL154]GFD98861.1 dihydrofolate reductase [Alteromonas sp. KUL156]
MMKIAMIAAMAKNRIIGADNDMPWHLPADLKHFKAVTLGKAVIMGRKTYESIGRALLGRPNIVITSNKDYSLSDATVVDSPESAFEVAKALSNQSGPSDEIMIIGGGTIYQSFLEKADTLYLTHIELAVEGDTQFPDYEAAATWTEVSRESHSPDEKNAHAYTFVTLVKNEKK